MRFLSEYVVSEIIQELPLLIATGGTATMLRGGATVTAKALGKEFGENAAKRAAVGFWCKRGNCCSYRC